MEKVDLNFFYKNSVRKLLISKLYYLENTHQIPLLSKILCNFSLTKLEDCDDSQIYNYFYLFKFFFGRVAYLTKFKSYFKLGTWSYSFRVFIIFQKKEVFDTLFFIINDLLYKLDENYIKRGIYSIKLNIFSLCVRTHIFSEKKTNLGLFNLKKKIDFKFFINGFDIRSSKFFFKNIKIYIY